MKQADLPFLSQSLNYVLSHAWHQILISFCRIWLTPCALRTDWGLDAEWVQFGLGP